MKKPLPGRVEHELVVGMNVSRDQSMVGIGTNYGVTRVVDVRSQRTGIRIAYGHYQRV